MKKKKDHYEIFSENIGHFKFEESLLNHSSSELFEDYFISTCAFNRKRNSSLMFSYLHIYSFILPSSYILTLLQFYNFKIRLADNTFILKSLEFEKKLLDFVSRL